MTEQDLKIIFLNNRVAWLTEQVTILRSYIMQCDHIETMAGEAQAEQIQREANNET